jgi:hypothetical protein
MTPIPLRKNREIWPSQPGFGVKFATICATWANRAGIPETLGQAGVLLPLPERLTPASQILPTAEQVEPWVEAVIRLWDDPAWYQMWDQALR